MNISSKTTFSIIFIATIALARFWIFMFPEISTIVMRWQIHHFWVGLGMIVIGLQLSYNTKIPIVAIGLGLIIDELAFIMLGGGGYEQYWSASSLTGLIIFTTITLFAMSKIIFFLKNLTK